MSNLVSFAGAVVVLDYAAQSMPQPLRVGDSVSVRHKGTYSSQFKNMAGVIVGFEPGHKTINLVVAVVNETGNFSIRRIPQKQDDGPHDERWEISAASPWLKTFDRIALEKALFQRIEQHRIALAEAETYLEMYQALANRTVPEDTFDGEYTQQDTPSSPPIKLDDEVPF